MYYQAKNNIDPKESDMYNACSDPNQSGRQIVDKIRMMGFNSTPVAAPFNLTCTNCSTEFTMEYMETQCPSCRMVYGVTPCQAHDKNSVKPAGINY